MKQTVFLLGILFFILILSGCELDKEQIKDIQVDLNTIVSEIEIHEFTLDSVLITVTHHDDSQETIPLTEDMISPEDFAKLQEPGTHEIMVTYQKQQATFVITLYDITDTSNVVQFVDFDGMVLKEETVKYGEAATAPSIPTRDGYTFNGWDKAFDNITAHEIITAQYERNTYTVKFIDYDGTILKEETVTHGGRATAPQNPTREEYTFIRWDQMFSSVLQNMEINAFYRSNENFELEGYTIRIAESLKDIALVDPFNENYNKPDRAFKQAAWQWVEETYKCNIEVVAYPASAEYGPQRWNYILNQAADNTADYDFYRVSDSQIHTLVEGNALLDVDAWYTKYGNNFMNNIYIQSGTYRGKLYSITDEDPSLNNVMYYNIQLLSRLGLEKTPAELFNEGNWTYTTFRDYCLAAQAALDNLPGASQTNKYYAVSGCSPFYWVGMTHAGGARIIDVANRTFEPLSTTAQNAAIMLQSIKAAGAMDPAKQADAGVVSWNNGRALFSSGSLWFVNESTRWKEDLWTPGNSDQTQYGYVPFPRSDDMTKEQQKIGVSGTNTWVMARGRDYSGYGPQCTPEFIYRVMVKAMQLTEYNFTHDVHYDYNELLQLQAQKYTESLDSIVAFKYMAGRINEIGFYEPIADPINPIINTAASKFSTAVNDFVMGNATSLTDAVSPLTILIIEEIQKVYR